MNTNAEPTPNDYPTALEAQLAERIFAKAVADLIQKTDLTKRVDWMGRHGAPGRDFVENEARVKTRSIAKVAIAAAREFYREAEKPQ